MNMILSNVLQNGNVSCMCIDLKSLQNSKVRNPIFLYKSILDQDSLKSQCFGEILGEMSMSENVSLLGLQREIISNFEMEKNVGRDSFSQDVMSSVNPSSQSLGSSLSFFEP